MMKACAIVVAVALALVTSGCGSRQQAIAEAKSGNGTVPKTRLIMATLNQPSGNSGFAGGIVYVDRYAVY